MNTKIIVGTAVLAASLWGSSDLMAQSKTSYRSPSYTSPARSTYQPLPIKREPMYPTTRNERISLGNENAWRTQQNWRNH